MEVSTGCLKGKSNLIWGAIKMKMQYQRSSWFGFHFVVTMQIALLDRTMYTNMDVDSLLQIAPTAKDSRIISEKRIDPIIQATVHNYLVHTF